MPFMTVRTKSNQDINISAREYAREYALGRYVKHRKSLKRRRIARTILTALAVLLAAVIAAAAVYLHALDSSLSLGENAESVRAALTPAEAGQPYYVLLLGSDSREGSGTSSKPAESGDNERSDVIILVRVDEADHLVSMLSIPRDTPWVAEDGTIMKINEIYNQSKGAGTIRAVEQLAGVKITHYAEVHFSDFENLVDALGGIDVKVPTKLSYKDALTGEKVTIEAGEQHLDGQQAQILARARHEYVKNQDANRQKAVRAIANAILTEVSSTPVPDMPKVVLSAANCVSTDLSSLDILSLAASFHGGATTYSGTAPFEGAVNDAASGLWLCYQDEEGWSRVIATMDADGDPGKVSYSGDTVTIAGTDKTFTLK